LIEDLGIAFYFEDAYASWQRGNNETSNGLLREYSLKKDDLTSFSDEDLFSALFHINHLPRKCLGYRTPFEVLLNKW
jgi:transposase insI for insertion sequence element IS30B/C/D